MQILNKQIDKKIGAIVVLMIFLIIAFLISVFFVVLGNKNFKNKDYKSPVSGVIFETEKIKKFVSEEEFKDYLQASTNETGNYYGGIGSLRKGIQPTEMLSMPMASQDASESKIMAPESMERVSETNVQVLGIDEPDIVKTNGKEIYFSSENNYWQDEVWTEEEQRPLRIENKTKIINAFPPSDLASISGIDKTGTLLLDKNNLIIFSDQEIFGYDVSDPKLPKEKWNVKLENNVSIADSRLYKDKIYLVTKTWIDQSRPCQMKLLTANEMPLEIKCIDIYHPVSPVPVDTTFVAMVLDPITGKIEKNISFVGSTDSSVVYMSENGIYITYSYSEGMIKMFSGFIKENQDVFPNLINEKIEKLENYDISSQAKLVEFQSIFEKYQSSLNNDERIRVENEMTNRMSKYYKDHQRELEKTGIVKIDLEKFDIKATGSVPGYPLNQFALDEYKNNLRIATTIGERGGMGFFGGDRETANDIYVLDQDLKIQGSIKNLGLTEKIYSARFMGDRGYLVTFRQTDPFYVLDLSDPKKPEMKGELKIPGYSSYLHPISNDIILGIGKESQQVKLSLFDVASPENPKEIDKYILDEYWSEALDNHHAFLLDKKHNIFFLPGNKGGYIFSYENNKFKLVKAISQVSAKRALFINDYLYIIGDDKITVLDEINWEKVNELRF
ncbi:MAG: beta-propeller domain-containing protein [bacterium]|nr:beta-propeller domain-containing protein [bacterium]